jgi:hypothetical protein
MKTPQRIVLKRPSFVSAIQAPRIGVVYARKVKESLKAEENCKPCPLRVGLDQQIVRRRILDIMYMSLTERQRDHLDCL